MPVKLKRIFICCEWYLPGFRAGGPIRSCVNFAEHMSDAYEIFIFTSDRDLNEPTAYKNIQQNTWILYKNNLRIYYVSSDRNHWKALKTEVNAIKPDFIYLNSMFSWRFTILPLLAFYRSLKIQIILAPRGMLSLSAVSFKRFKKTFFLSLFNYSGFYKRIRFHATDQKEYDDIRHFFPNAQKITVIPNFHDIVYNDRKSCNKIMGDLKLLFVGRLHPIKNLDYILTIIKEMNIQVSLSVIGSEENLDYVSYCKSIVKDNPKFIVCFLGEKTYEEVKVEIDNHHALILPSKSENYGHSIFESLSAGRPVIISDRTPWRNLEEHFAGWDLPLEDPVKFIEAIELLKNMDKDTYLKWSLGAKSFADRFMREQQLLNKYLLLFQ